MSDNKIIGTGGELRGKFRIIRAGTGKVEEFEMVGRVTPEQHEEIMAAVNAPKKEEK